MLGVASVRQIPSSPGEGPSGQKALPAIFAHDIFAHDNDEEKVLIPLLR
jgi:hypothetical protein